MPESMHSRAYAALVAALVATRKEAGLTQRELASRLGREQSFIGRIEQGQRRVDLVEFLWICKACGADGKSRLADVADLIVERLPTRRRRH